MAASSSRPNLLRRAWSGLIGLSDSDAERFNAVWGIDADGKRTRAFPTLQIVPPAKVFLNVPFAEKDQAKALGARWDKEQKAWFIQGQDQAAFDAWLPGAQQSADPVATFGDAVRQYGLRVERPEMDGKLHRVAVEGDKGRQKSGAYVGHLDGRPAGYIQNFKTDTKATWHQDGRFAAVDSAESARYREARRAIESGQQMQDRSLAAQTAQELWRGAQKWHDEMNPHPYLDRKDIRGDGLRIGERGQSVLVSDNNGGKRAMSVEGWLIVPVSTAENGLASLQFISPGSDGAKMFMPGGRCRVGTTPSGRSTKGRTF